MVVPGGVDRSGTERVIPALLWLIERVARDHRVTVIALGQEPQASTYELLGAQIINLAPAGPGSRALGGLLRRAVAAVGEAGKPDVIHGFWASVSGLAAVLAGRRYRVPSIVSVAGGELLAMPEIGYGGALGRGGRLIGSTTMRLATHITVSSGWMAGHVRARGFRVDDIVALGVDTGAFSPGSSLRPYHLVHVASRNQVKDPFTLLRAFSLVKAEITEATLEMIGVDVVDGAVERLVNELQLSDSVAISDFVPSSRLADKYRAAAVHVLSSRHDAAPVVVLEAAACAVPTVGTRVGHVSDLAALDPPAAVAVAPNDPAALSEAIIALIIDPAHRAAMGQAALGWAVAHDADHTARAFSDLYARLARPAR